MPKKTQKEQVPMMQTSEEAAVKEAAEAAEEAVETAVKEVAPAEQPVQSETEAETAKENDLLEIKTEENIEPAETKPEEKTKPKRKPKTKAKAKEDTDTKVKEEEEKAEENDSKTPPANKRRKSVSLALRANAARPRPQYRGGAPIVPNAEKKTYGKNNTEVDKEREQVYEDFRTSLDKNSRAKLKGTLVGASALAIKENEPPLIIAIVDYKGYKVKIPAYDFFLPTTKPDQEGIFSYSRENFTEQEIRRKIKRRFGSEVDFRVTKILDDYTVIGSRLLAMNELRQQWWIDALSKAKDKDGAFLPYIRPGISAKARIITVIDSGIYIELLGVESYIPNKDLGHIFMETAKDFFKVGDKIDIIITKVEKAKDGQVRFWASNRLATLARFRNDYDQIITGDNYMGEVLFVKFDREHNQLFFYVKLGERVQVRCTMGQNITRIPKKGSLVEIRILRKFDDTLMLTGVMTHLVRQ